MDAGMKETVTSTISAKALRALVSNRLQVVVAPLLALAAVVFVSRLPFLSSGYGFDADAWLIALSARQIAATGEYVASRLPGYPIPELFYALIPDSGPFVFNAITALLSAAAAVLFARIFKAFGGRDHILAGLAFAFTPVIYINSANSMDYLWALTFALGGLCCVLARRPLLAGALLGLAIGSRISTSAMLVPLSLLLYQPTAGRANLKPLLKLWLGAGVVAAISYAPVILTYGQNFFTVYEAPVTLLAVIARATVQVWGEVGLVAILAALALAVLRPRTARRGPSIPPVSRLTLAAWFTAIGVYGVAFLRLPLEAGYLIPAVPFCILALGRFLNRKLFVVVCLALIISPFLFNFSVPLILDESLFSNYWTHFDLLGEDVAVDFLYGPLIYEHLSRVYSLRLVEQILAFGEQATGKTVVVAGSWIPRIEMALGGDSQGKVEYVHLLDEAETQAYRDRGYQLYYMPGLEDIGMDRYGANLVDALNSRSASHQSPAD